MKPITVTLVLGKETKGTYRFENEDKEAGVQCIYIAKSELKNEKPPKSIRFTIEATA